MALPLGLALALVAGWLVLSGPQPETPESNRTPRTTQPSGPSAEIDDASRDRLSQILRAAEDQP